MELFVYGTLTDPDRVATVVDRFAFGPEAVLVGLERVTGRYPTLVPGGRTEGRLLWTPDPAPVDRYEGVDRGLYVRVTVDVAAGSPADSAHAEDRTPARDPSTRSNLDAGDAGDAGDGRETTAGETTDDRDRDWSTVESVATYVGDPDRLGVDARWPGDGPFDRRVRRYVHERSPVVRPVS